ncbi:MAG: translation initiation factor IF-2 [Deltaproteobacteria bacterium]|nr:translation initiation factor IF-2 [Deltaproteobacteria bacterium]
MSKMRVYELAKELRMDSHELVERLKGAGFSINNHMSALDGDDVGRARDYLSGATSEVFEEKRIKPTVIRRRKKLVPKVQESIEQEEPPVAEEEISPPEAEASVPEEEPRRAVEEAQEEEAKEEPPAEPVVEEAEPKDQALSPEPKGEKPERKVSVVKPKLVKRKKEKPKAPPAKIIKMPDIPPPEPKVQEPIPSKTRADITPFPMEAFRAEPEGKKGKKALAREEKEIGPRKEYRRRKKEIIERKDLYGEEREYGFVGRAKAKKKDKLDKKKFKQTEITVPKASKRRIKVPDTMSVAELARRMGIKATELIKKLMELDMKVTINQTIGFDSAALVASEFEYELELETFDEQQILADEEDRAEDLAQRPPVITIMGHVDHGKTSLLDYIRKTRVIDQESGGITQHIGAYYVTTPQGDVVFLDTPGHEAFTAMRARGARITDMIVLVVAADDGVMDQTAEAIDHAKAAGIPIVVAVNKMDKANANPEKVRRDLSNYGLLSEEWGGDTLFTYMSAKTGEGVDELLESILLQSEILETKANYKKSARGTIIEARLDKNRGPVATLLIRSGTLHQGDFFVCGAHFGRVRAMLNDRGQKITSATPSMPVEIYGISEVPMAGDDFTVVPDEKTAKLVSGHRSEASVDGARGQNALRLENLFERISEGEVKELNIIVKADVQGSLEALQDNLVKLSTDAVKLNVIHSGTGAATESDVMLASASKAIIICFNVRANPTVRTLAEKEQVDVRFYDVIYKVIEDVRSAMTGLLEPIYSETIIGRAEVKQIFHVSKVGTIAGCYVIDGKVERGSKVRLLREEVVVYDGSVASLKRFKDDAKEVLAGFECGVGLENYNDIKPGDVLEFYALEETKAEL